MILPTLPWRADRRIYISDDPETRSVHLLEPEGEAWQEISSEWEWFLDFAMVNTSHCCYQYHIISQILKQNPVERIVELGTFRGALALYLGICGAMLDIPVVTYDRDRPDDMVLGALGKIGVEFIQADYTVDPPDLSDVVYLICDGDHKAKAGEFQMFAPRLKEGSVISVHDWGYEVGSEDVNDTIEKCGLRPFGPGEWLRHGVQFATWIKGGE